MPYTKEVGKSPVYNLGFKTIDFDIGLHRFLTQVKVPLWAPGITYKDSFDAYIQNARRWTPFQRLKMVYLS